LALVTANCGPLYNSAVHQILFFFLRNIHVAVILCFRPGKNMVAQEMAATRKMLYFLLDDNVFFSDYSNL
jgi:hypothetical protein